jgi:hypothetical protein
MLFLSDSKMDVLESKVWLAAAGRMWASSNL